MAEAMPCPEFGAYGQILSEICRVTRRTAPNLESQFNTGNRPYSVQVTVGNEPQLVGSICEFYCEAEEVAVTGWLDMFQPNWKQLLHSSKNSAKRMPASLYSHCESGNIDGVKAALRRGENLNRIWQFGTCGNPRCTEDPYCDFKSTPLQGAIKFNQTDVVTLLLEQPGLNLNITTFRDYTALNFACMADRPSIVRQLVKVPGIDPNISNEFERSPLMEAYFRTHQDCAKELIYMDEVDLPESFWKTRDGKPFEPWFRKMLIQAKVQREKQAKEKELRVEEETPVEEETQDDEVAEGDERPLDQKLPDNIEVKLPSGGSRGTVKLTRAIELHRLVLEDLDQLERRSAEITASITNATCSLVGYNEANTPLSSSTITPLWLACFFQAWDSAILLLNKGCNPNKAVRKEGGFACTPLYLAAKVGSTKVCRSLLENGARQDIDTGGGGIGDQILK